MVNNFNKVLKTCIEQARRGKSDISVFDLMYETGLPYPELKDILDKLVLKNELAVIDIKTYKFTGDINRKLDEIQPKDDLISAKLAELEEKRQALISRMRRMRAYEAHEDNYLFAADTDDDNETDEEELRHCDYDEDMDLDGLVKQEELIGLLKTLFQSGHKNTPFSVPIHISWDDEDDFLRFCAEQIIRLISKNKEVGRQGVIKKALLTLDNIRQIHNAELIEVYERIVYELKNMSNYYFNKIREQCS